MKRIPAVLVFARFVTVAVLLVLGAHAQAQTEARLAMLVLHDDTTRAYVYGPTQGLPNTRVGTFPQTLYDKAKQRGWIVISMKNDWKQVFAFQGK